MSETVLQEGSVGDLPLIDIFLLVRSTVAPVYVELSRGHTMRRFHFRDGQLAAFTTNNSKESFTEFLVRKKKLQRPVADSVLQVAESEGITPAQAILRDRILPALEVAGLLGSWASLLLVQAFSWTEGSYRVLAEESDSPPPETPMEFSLPVVLAQGVWKRMSIDEVRRFVASYLDFRAEPISELPFPVEEFRMDPQQMQLWTELQTADSVQEAMDTASLGEEDALRLVFLLQRAGMIELVPADGPRTSAAPADSFEDEDPFGFDLDSFDMDLDGPSTSASEASSSPTPVAPSPRRPPTESAGREDLGVDLSSIGFRGGASHGNTTPSRTVHVGGGGREELGRGAPRSGMVPPSPRATKQHPSPETPQPLAGNSHLAGLFDDIGVKPQPRSPVTPPRGVAPPRGGKPRPPGARVAAPPRGAAHIDRPEPSDGPPQGPGPLIEDEEWNNLSTKEKDRIRGLREMLREMESQTYFEIFELTEEASSGMIKKAYFKLARRFHPDALVDEGEIYARLAEAVFTKVSEAYETLEDDEAREKYVAKYIRGEKDENELAMERVQQILGAEAAYKAGIRLINQGKAVKAVEKLQEAVDGYDEEAEYRGWLGYALFRANQAADYEKALSGEEMLLQAISEKPHVADLPHLMGKISIMRKDWGNARMWLRKSLKINADNPEALREYKRVDEVIKGVTAKPVQDEAKGLKGLFGRFGKK